MSFLRIRPPRPSRSFGVRFQEADITDGVKESAVDSAIDTVSKECLLFVSVPSGVSAMLSVLATEASYTVGKATGAGLLAVRLLRKPVRGGRDRVEGESRAERSADCRL